MKKSIPLAFMVATSLILLGCSGCQKDKALGLRPDGTPRKGPHDGVELVVASWGWSSANVLRLSAPFMEETGALVRIDETAGNVDRLNRLREQKAAPAIDVALLSESYSAIGNAEGLFEKINSRTVTNLSNLYGFARNKDGFGPAYSVVRYGLIYDAAKVPVPPASYRALFNGAYDGLVSIPDMAATAGPFLLVSLAEGMGGSMANVDDAFALLARNKRNIAQFYMSSADVRSGFESGRLGVTVYLDTFVPVLRSAGIDARWIEAEEGCFPLASTINVVKNAPHAALAQLYVNYFLSNTAQNQMASDLSEAPTSKTAVIPPDKQDYLLHRVEDADALRIFDWQDLESRKANWINRFQREVAN